MTPLDRYRALRPDQQAAVRDTWPAGLPAPGNLTSPQHIAQANAHIDSTVGFDEAIPRDQLIAGVGAALRGVGLIADDCDHSEAAIVTATGQNIPAPQLTDEQLHDVWTVTQQVRRGDLVLRFTDTDRPYLTTRAASHLEQQIAKTLPTLAAELAKTPHPDDHSIGLWRVVEVTITPTGDTRVRRLEGHQAAAHVRATEQPTTPTQEN